MLNFLFPFSLIFYNIYKEINVPLNQESNTITYTFTVSPTSIEFTKEGGTRILSIVSTKSGSNGSTESLGYSYSWKSVRPMFSFSGNTITASSTTSILGSNDTLTLTQNESGKTQTVDVSQKGTGGGGIKQDCTVTLSYRKTGGNNICAVSSDKAVTSTITITVNVTWVRNDTGKTYTGSLSSTIQKGSTTGNNIRMSDVINDGYNWNTLDTRSIFGFGNVNPVSDDTYNYKIVINEN